MDIHRFKRWLKLAVIVMIALACKTGIGQVWQTANTAPTITRGPYLQVGTPNSIVVRWRSDGNSDSRIRYGTNPQNLDQIANLPENTVDHEVLLSGLSPETRYYYAIGNSSDGVVSDPGFYFVTAPAANARKKVRIWVLGDAGTGNQDARDVRDAYYSFTGTTHTDLWVMVGDNAYSDGEDDEYQEKMFDIYPTMLSKSVLWPAFGNHDGKSADSKDGSGVFYDIFTLPANAEAGGTPSTTEAYYSFDFANIHFICLNSHDIDRSQNGEMLQWLKEDLNQNGQDWTIAYWHHPPYSKGSHDSDDEDQLIEMRENAVPILEAGGIDLVISGHSHSYERSYLLDGHHGKSGSLTSAMILDSGDGSSNKDGAYEKETLGAAPHEGAVYVVAGSSGKTSGGSLDHPAMMYSFEELGSVVLDVDSARLDLTFLNDQGDTRDSFTMIKGTGVVSITPADGNQLPETIALLTNFPNPFNPITTIRFDLPVGSASVFNVRLDIIDIRGRVVNTLIKEPLAPGEYGINWDATNLRGERVPSGVYIFRLRANQTVKTRKMVLSR